MTISKSDTWEFFTTGRVNAFLSYGFGDANPLPLTPGVTIPPGGGLSVGNDSMPRFGPDGMQVQGTFTSMRLRSGFVPNVFGLGLRRQLSERTQLKVFVAFWATIESEGQRKTQQIYTDAREGYVKVEGPWGSLLAGRALDLFSRGATENDFLYGHGFSLGFPGNIDSNGPTAGLISFGVMAAFFAPGLVYATPSLGGLQLTAGVYDATPLPGGYEATRYARPEGELTYDWKGKSAKLHLFFNAMYQDVYRSGSNNKATAHGLGYGGRVEVGPVHLGVAGHRGPGLGLAYALQPGAVSVSETFELRTFDGYSGLLQFVTSRFDFNVGAGMSRCFLLETDRMNPITSILDRQIGYSAAIVFHQSENLHFSIDFLRGDARWSLGEKQVFNFVNTGVVATW
ncbi:MAG: porin [Pseudomonadota bacterium]